MIALRPGVIARARLGSPWGIPPRRMKGVAMNARITWTQYPSELVDQLEAAAKQASSVIEPILKGTPGFRGGYWMADRSNGLMVGLTFWDSMDGINAYE